MASSAALLATIIGTYAQALGPNDVTVGPAGTNECPVGTQLLTEQECQSLVLTSNSVTYT